MARARIIKPSFFQHEDLAELTPLERLFFIGLWTVADYKGCVEWRPKRLKIQLMPYDDIDLEQCRSVLERFNFIRSWSDGKRTFVKIINFERHQNPHRNERAKGSDLPDCPEVPPESENPEIVSVETEEVTENSRQIAINPDLNRSTRDQNGTARDLNGTARALTLNPLTLTLDISARARETPAARDPDPMTDAKGPPGELPVDLDQAAAIEDTLIWLRQQKRVKRLPMAEWVDLFAELDAEEIDLNGFREFYLWVENLDWVNGAISVRLLRGQIEAFKNRDKLAAKQKNHERNRRQRSNAANIANRERALGELSGIDPIAAFAVDQSGQDDLEDPGPLPPVAELERRKPRGP